MMVYGMPKSMPVRDKNGNSIPYLVQKDQDKDSIHVWYQEVLADSLWLDIQHESSKKSYPVKTEEQNKRQS
jgi:hypothetical protein